MARNKPTPDFMIGVLRRIPEGFIRKALLTQRFKGKALKRAVATGFVRQEGDIYYDTLRLTTDKVRELREWCNPSLPRITPDFTFRDAPIIERLETRQQQLSPDEQRLVRLLEFPGYAEPHTLCQSPEDESLLQQLLESEVLKEVRGLIYDPLRLSESTLHEIHRWRDLAPVRQQIIHYLAAQTNHTVRRMDICQHFDKEIIDAMIEKGWLIQFSVTFRREPNTIAWITHPGADLVKARRFAAAESKIKDSEWQTGLHLCGDVLRPDAKDGKTYRMQVIARSYVLSKAAKRLGIKATSLEQNLHRRRLKFFKDPAGSPRFAAADIERARIEPEYGLHFTGNEILTAREISLVSGLSYSAVRYRLEKAGISRTRPTWKEVYGKWGLPVHLHEFKDILKVKKAEWRAERHRAYLEEQRKLEEQYRQQLEEVRRQQALLREKLLPVFPTWEHEGRELQRVFLHIGPPNSGKTHEALKALVAAGSGWYLAPLRLLAFEIFDRLNSQGIACNLLTGEEYIPVEGARLTASTIEMFNPAKSGQCVIIDEAQLLADRDRGWAWTRALMEARSPEIHIIAPPTGEQLIRRLAAIVSLSVTKIAYERLCPIQVAEHPWPLNRIPNRTIVVAFSRRMVLELKTQFEHQHRPVSVIYGNLPPEVRRRQADRFANGETDICVATDAVGMGLNLPADYVCFYELEKFDGERVRGLTPAEVQQIGGRAGRYGFSEIGEVGAVSQEDLDTIRKLFETTPLNLTRARVAPPVEALALIPGTLAEKLKQWAALESIPDNLRDAFKTADMTERIELATLLHPHEVDTLGLDTALKLVNAPAKQNSRSYWRWCASAILSREALPLPPEPPSLIQDAIHLEDTENSIACADIYLWLSRRPEFRPFTPDDSNVREMRQDWSIRIDAALLKKIESARRCSNCGTRLPKAHPYGLCSECYESRFNFYRRQYDSYEDDETWHRSAFSRPEIPEYRHYCLACQTPVETAGLPRLQHWKEAHPQLNELTKMQVGWLLGLNRLNVEDSLPYDYRRQNGLNEMRIWKLSTVEAYLNNSDKIDENAGGPA